MLKYQPGLVMTLLEKGDNPEQGYHPEPSPSTKPNWCKCTNCRKMSTERESKYCGYVTANCLSKHQEINIVVLGGAILRVVRNFRNDVYAMPQEKEADKNRAMRHAAYKQFVLWQFDKFGKGDRCAISSCCTWKILDK